MNETDPIFSKFQKIMSFSHCVKQEQVAKSLGISIDDLFEKLIEWNGKIPYQFHLQDELIVKENRKEIVVSPEVKYSRNPAPKADLIKYQPRTKKLIYDADLTSQESAVYEKLRRWRNKESSSKGFKPYLIAHNSALKAIVHYKISNLEELSKVSGFSRQKVELYGQKILEILRK